MLLRKPEMALFDLDGTLVDTAPDLAHAIDTMLLEMELPARGEERVRGWIGNGIERLVKRALTNDFYGEPEADVFERGLALFVDIYANNACVKSRIYPGVMDAIDWLKTKHCKLGCVTNKRGMFTAKVLDTLGLSEHFSIVISGDTLVKKKPDPLPLLHAADFLGVPATNGLMIGDSITDIIAANNAGFQMLYVTYGYNQGRDIRQLQLDAILDSLIELPAIFQ